MSSVSSLNSPSKVRASGKSQFSLRAFFRAVWASYERHSEQRVMLELASSQVFSRRRAPEQQ